jgi:hypothetical protein
MPGPFAPPSGMYPALYLYPLNDSFVPKHIALPAGQRIKIGRQTNAKTVPAERNGFFDSKVLSRQHAEVWEEGAKVCITVVRFLGLVHRRRVPVPSYSETSSNHPWWCMGSGWMYASCDVCQQAIVLATAVGT